MKNIFDSWLVKRPIAHRGLFNKETPENTLGSFKNAVDNNFAVELDVQMTTDGVLVVYHDFNMKRLCNYDEDIRNHSYEEIKNLKINNSIYSIPTFKEVLDLIDGKVPILVEVKDHKNIGNMETKIRDMLRKYKGEYAIESFNPFIIRWFYKNANEMYRGQLSYSYNDSKFNFIVKYALRHLWLTKYNHSEFIAYDINDVKRKQILKIKKKKPIILWTVRDPNKLNNIKNYYNGYIFEGYIPNK